MRRPSLAILGATCPVVAEARPSHRSQGRRRPGSAACDGRPNRGTGLDGHRARPPSAAAALATPGQPRAAPSPADSAAAESASVPSTPSHGADTGTAAELGESSSQRQLAEATGASVCEEAASDCAGFGEEAARGSAREEVASDCAQCGEAADQADNQLVAIAVDSSHQESGEEDGILEAAGIPDSRFVPPAGWHRIDTAGVPSDEAAEGDGSDPASRWRPRLLEIMERGNYEDGSLLAAFEQPAPTLVPRLPALPPPPSQVRQRLMRPTSAPNLRGGGFLMSSSPSQRCVASGARVPRGAQPFSEALPGELPEARLQRRQGAVESSPATSTQLALTDVEQEVEPATAPRRSRPQSAASAPGGSGPRLRGEEGRPVLRRPLSASGLPRRKYTAAAPDPLPHAMREPYPAALPDGHPRSMEFMLDRRRTQLRRSASALSGSRNPDFKSNVDELRKLVHQAVKQPRPKSAVT